MPILYTFKPILPCFGPLSTSFLILAGAPNGSVRVIWYVTDVGICDRIIYMLTTVQAMRRIINMQFCLYIKWNRGYASFTAARKYCKLPVYKSANGCEYCIRMGTLITEFNAPYSAIL